jgi:6-phosphogluconolactonase (cycloisomerase 2 family)
MAPGGTQPSTSKGVYVFKMDGATGALTPVQLFEIENPSWVTVDANATHLCATSEVTTWNGASDTGGITASSIDPGTGRITSPGDQQTGGSIPAHAVIDPSGRFVLVANYVGANWSVLPIQGNGALGAASAVWPAVGKGPNVARQDAPHPRETLILAASTSSAPTWGPITCGRGRSTRLAARLCRTRISTLRSSRPDPGHATWHSIRTESSCT